MITLKQLGKKLKKIREKIGYSQSFVANKLGITRQAIINIEAGRRKVDSFEMFKLADLYNFDVEDMLLKEQQNHPSFQEAIMHMGKKKFLDNNEKKALFKFQKICQDYNFLQSP